MFEKIKVFFIGLITGLVSFFTLSFFRNKRKNVSNNGKGTDTIRVEQSDDARTSGKIETRLETVESIAGCNESIFNEIRKRKKDN